MLRIIAGIFAWSIIAYHVLYGLYLQIMNLVNSRKILRRQEKSAELSPGLPVSFVVVVPCWKEQKIICDTIDHFSKFCELETVEKVLIVTSCSEQAVQGKRTSDLACAYLNGHPYQSGIEVVQCPPELISKPAKVNYAVRQWLGKRADTKQQYICLYDADSRPSPDALKDIADLIAKTGTAADIYQQVSCYCNNIASIKGPKKLYALADAIAQTHWALSFEYALYEEYSFCQKRNRLTPPYYLIGHGLFVSVDYFDRIGGIPEINHCDDAALGFLSGLLNASLQIIPRLDICDVAPTSLASVLQSRSWFRGSNQYDANLQYFMEKYQTKPGGFQRFYWSLRENLRNFMWGWRAPLLLAAFVLGLAMDLPGVLLGVLAGVISYVQIPYFLTYFTLRKMKDVKLHLRPWEFILGAITAIAVFVGRCIGPFLGSLEFKKSKNNFTYKTER